MFLVVLVIILILGIVIYRSTKTSQNNLPVHATVEKWYPNTDALEVKLTEGKVGTIITLQLKEYPQTRIIAINPKDRVTTTILIKSQYTSQEWGRAFCEGDILLIGTKENNWSKVKNYMQITPDFVNVEDRVCYNSQSAN